MENKEILFQFYPRSLSPKAFKSDFRLTEVVGNLEVQDLKPFKKLKFENTEEHLIEKNSEKNIEISEIISDISFSFEEPKEKEIPHVLSSAENKSKQVDLKISPKSKKSEKFSTIYTLSSDSSKFAEDILEAEKPGSTKSTQNEDKENIPTKSKEYLEFLPAKKFCKTCKTEVLTTVKMELPTMPL